MSTSVPQPAVFVDRDGVINAERGHVHRKEDFELLPGATAGLRLLQAAGWRLVVVTNQAGIGRGLYTEADYEALTRHMRTLLRRQGIVLDAVYHCPHAPATDRADAGCDCRKPRPGMILRARAELRLDLARSVLVGDKRSDLVAGRAAGVGRVVLVESGHAIDAADRAAADVVCADLLAAAGRIVCEADVPAPA